MENIQKYSMVGDHIRPALVDYRYVDFGTALKALKEGKQVCRSGWNGKGMWLTLVRGSHPEVTTGDYQVNTNVWPGECLPYIGMKTADNKFVPWLASQTDVLAEDWIIL